MSEQIERGGPNLFDQFCDLASQRAQLYDVLDSGQITEGSVLAVYREELVAVSQEIDGLMIAEGFTDAVVAGGLAAERALEQLNNPVLLKRRTEEQLTEARQPFLTRLELAAGYLNEFAKPDPNVVRVTGAARAAGITLVERVSLFRTPLEPDELPELRAAASTKDAVTVVVPVEASAESPLDRYLTLQDAGLLVGVISRFSSVLEDNGIAPLSQGIAELLVGLLPSEETAKSQDQMVSARVAALDRITQSLSKAESMSDALAQSEGDPRHHLLTYLRDTITSAESLLVLQDLVRAERQLTIVVHTPSRSGTVIDKITSTVAVESKQLDVSPAAQPVVGEVRPTPALMPKARTVPVPPGLAVDAAESGEAAAPKELVIANIDHLTSRLSEQDRTLAQVCLVRLSEIHTMALQSNLELDGAKAYPGSFLAEMLSYPSLLSAIRSAREDRILGSRLSGPRDISVTEAAVAVVYSSPALKGYIKRNEKLVGQILTAIKDSIV